MTELLKRLLNVEPLDVDELLQESGPELHELRVLNHVQLRGLKLARLAGQMLDKMRRTPPVSVVTYPDSAAPWWQPMPAAYVAALFLHVGLRGLGHFTPGEVDGLPPHQRQGAKMSREILRRLGAPFTVREHAVALVLNYRKPENLVGSGSPDEAILRLACRLDLRALIALKMAELEILGDTEDDTLRSQVERFRQRAQSLGVDGAAPPAQLRAEEIRQLGFAEPARAHRATNALRFFDLKTEELGRPWLRNRLQSETEMRTGRLHLLIGPAGSGKSRWARHNLAHTQIVSSDRMREELTGDPSDQSQNYLVFQRCMSRIRNHLHDGKQVTFDATNYREELRDQPVQTGRWCGAEIYSYFLDVGLETTLRRNERRERRVPEKVIHRHYRLLTPPALYEADRHHYVDPQGRCQLYWPIP